MTLLIILLSLASERYLVHTVSENRILWFDTYYGWIESRLPERGVGANPYLSLMLIMLPVLLFFWSILSIFDNILYGVLGFVIQLLVFYSCLGPENAFYPVSAEVGDETAAADYFAKANNQVFAVIFWFIVLGPLGVLAYRLLSFCTEKALTQRAALPIISLADWLTARLTVLLYLLVGNFQKGFRYYSKMFLLAPAPENNQSMLKNGGLLAAGSQEGETLSLPYAQILVEHALVVCLVLLALFTF